MRLLHEIAIFQTVKSKVIISLFETVRLSVSILLRNLYNSLNSIKEIFIVVYRLFDYFSPHHCKSDLSKFGYLEVFQTGPWSSR